jgi:hypothetical protein
LPDISVSAPSQRVAGITPEPAPYIFRQSGQKTFSKNLTTETTYRVKFTDVWKGKELRDIFKDMQQMFEDVLTKAKGSEQDLSCVIVRHPELNHPIVVPLDKWSNINTNTVMTAVENVLNSDQKFSLSDQTEVLIGNISVPKGSGRVHYNTIERTAEFHQIETVHTECRKRRPHVSSHSNRTMFCQIMQDRHAGRI